jgi:hypothetical protein
MVTIRQCAEIAVMNNLRKILKILIIIAIALVAPFAVFEFYTVVRFGFSNPYTYLYSIPLAIVSFLLMQFAIGYGVVKGWSFSGMPGNYYLIVLWLISLLKLFMLPQLFSKGPMS